MSRGSAIRFAIMGLLVFCVALTAQAAVKNIYVHTGGTGGPVPGAADGHILRFDGSGGSMFTVMAPGTIAGLGLGTHRPRGIDCDDVNGELYFNGFGTGGGVTAKTWRIPMIGGVPTLVLNHFDAGGNDISIDQNTVGGGCPRLYHSQSVSFGTFHGVKSFDCVGAGVIVEFDAFLNGTPYGSANDIGWWADGLDYDEATGDVIHGDPGIINTPGSINGIQRWASGGGVGGYVTLQTHLDGQGRGMAIHPTNGMIYFAEHMTAGTGGAFVYETSATVAGAPLTVLNGGPGPGRPRDVALDVTMGELYWVDETLGTVEKVSIAGGPVTTVVTGLDAPGSLCLTFENVEVPATTTSGTLALMLGLILAMGIVTALYGARRVLIR